MMIAREYALEVFRRAVIDALDQASEKCFGTPGLHGWKDQDLPALFKTLDRHVDNLADRFDVKLSDI
jgi:hypothetical protein